jgi:two-component system cell cycle response regulator DivK
MSGTPPRRHVLVVEDFTDARELYCAFLEFHGFEAHPAVDGEEGLALAKSLLPAAIVLDIGLPGLDGLSVLAAVRGDPAIASTPVVIVTARGESSIRARAMALGASAFLTKPCLPEDLMLELGALLPTPA